MTNPCTATRHDTTTAYQAYGCRCPRAKEAQARYKKQLRHEKHLGIERKVDATGARRRFQALMAIGWSSHELMRRLGYAQGGVWLYYAERLNVRTVEKVKDLYDELWDTPGPSKWTRTFAANRGFLPPLAWDDDSIDLPDADPPFVPHLVLENVRILDEIAIERFIAGDLHWRDLTVPERIASAQKMQDLGYSRNEIHARCHVNQQTLQAALVAARQAA